MLIWRVVLGIAFSAALAALCWLDYQADPPGLWLLPLALVAAALGAVELGDLFVPSRGWGDHFCPVASTLCVVGASGVYLWRPDYPAQGPVGQLGWALVGVVAGLYLTLACELFRFRSGTDARPRVAAAVAAMTIVGVPVSVMIHLRAIFDDAWGMLALCSLLIPVKLGDIGAYTAGRLIGRHKMAPAVSPGKTWEGLVGGLMASVLGSYATFNWLAPAMNLEALPLDTTAMPRWVAFGCLVGLGGVMGDLAESLLKRSAGAKDSSRWMPGFGGVLDLLDSLLGGGAVCYALWVVGLVGPR